MLLPSKYSVLRAIMSILPVLAYSGMLILDSSDKVLCKGSIYPQSAYSDYTKFSVQYPGVLFY